MFVPKKNTTFEGVARAQRGSSEGSAGLSAAQRGSARSSAAIRHLVRRLRKKFLISGAAQRSERATRRHFGGGSAGVVVSASQPGGFGKVAAQRRASFRTSQVGFF